MNVNRSLPDLPLLKTIRKNNRHVFDWQHTLIIAVQHLLPTTVSLFKTMVEFGLLPNNIFMLGKYYSTNIKSRKFLEDLGVHIQNSRTQHLIGRFSDVFQEDIRDLLGLVKHELNRLAIEEIIVIDDGGHLISNIPREMYENYPIIGIEQTQSGLTRIKKIQVQFAIVNVASSAVKKYVEPPIICDAIIKRLSTEIPIMEKKLSCGIVGFGAIGKSLSEELAASGHSICVLDPFTNIQLNTYKWCCATIEELLIKSDYIFGCSGKDITKTLPLESLQYLNKNKHLISCSSEDIEFLSMLKFIQQHDNTDTSYQPLDDLTYTLSFNSKLRIYRGGFPINFNNNVEIEPPERIQITRGLVLSAVIQASKMLHDIHRKNNLYAVDSELQNVLVQEWSRLVKFDSRMLKSICNFRDIEWIRRHSEGIITELNSRG